MTLSIKRILPIATVALLGMSATSCSKTQWQKEESPTQIVNTQHTLDSIANVYDQNAKEDSARFQNDYRTDINNYEFFEFFKKNPEVPFEDSYIVERAVRSYHNNITLSEIYSILANNYQKIHDQGFAYYPDRPSSLKYEYGMSSANCIIVDKANQKYREAKSTSSNEMAIFSYLKHKHDIGKHIGIDKDGNVMQFNSVGIERKDDRFLENSDKTKPSYFYGSPNKYKLVEETQYGRRYTCVDDETKSDIIIRDDYAYAKEVVRKDK